MIALRLHVLRPPYLTLGCLFALAPLFATFAATPAAAHTPEEDMVEVTNRLLVSLDDAQRQKATYTFDDPERLNWHFIPKQRDGLALQDMQPHQRHYAMAMLNSALSNRGFSKAVSIMALEQILHEMENNSPRRNPLLYHFYVFGRPEVGKTWGWRVEGHHLSVNITLVNGQQIVSTPAFLGANPAHVKSGPMAGLRVLGQEEDLARELLASLDDIQRKRVIVTTEAPRDVINGPGRKAEPLQPAGLAAAELKGKQRRILMTLVREYVSTLRPELAKQELTRIREAGVDKIHFAWAGSEKPGEGHYYRIQGPTFILEYDNTQNDANHVHTVWRDFTNDFGEDLLRKHYEQVPHKE